MASAKPVMLSAVQPTNRLTLGNYLGAIRRWVEHQEAHQCLFFAVDLHSLTTPQDPQALREQTYFAIASYMACGIDPTKSILFVQSHVPEHAELNWILTCMASMGELHRMTQFKDKSAKLEGKNIGAGLFTYPVLMAADILLYDTAFVPVGEDQKQHVELTRDLALRFNHRCGKDIFRVPQPMIAKVGARIMDLQHPDMKMSKSDSAAEGAVYLGDTDKDIERKFKRAVTDSGSVITADPAQAGVHNLLTIQAVLTGHPVDALAQSYTGKMYGHLKVDTAQMVQAALKPIRDQTQAYLGDRVELDRILAKGAEKARTLAHAKLRQVKEALGLVLS
jgi:tryptophanyl-tRNA synthetase